MFSDLFNTIPMSKSIKGKVIMQVSGLLSLAMIFITIVVALLIHRQMIDQMEILLRSNVYDSQQRLEERISSLVDNTEVLAKNELLINALLDSQGRQTYLQTLAKNFMQGKDVISLSVLDFDGRAIFKTQDDIPRYDKSLKLRSALALQETDLYLQDKTHNIVVVVPIKYYSTSQGALVVVFNTKAISNSIIPNDLPVSLRLYNDTLTVFDHHQFGYDQYRLIRLDPLKKTPYLSRLEISLELGLLESAYMGPVKEALFPLVLIAILFIALGLVISYLLGEKITRPIVELYNRVESSSGADYTPCSPLGTDDELEALAASFDQRSYTLQHLAKYDSLTGLPNRLFFIDRLENALLRSERDSSILAILSLGLDNFKNINDTMGHATGDNVLVYVSRILSDLIAVGDTVARSGGDEFTILIENVSSEDYVVDLIEQITNRFKEQIHIDKFRFYVSTRIGIALYPQNGNNAETLLQNANTAMDKAKAEGGNRYQFYNAEMTQAAYERMYLRNQIQHAILREEFVVFYQGQTDMRTGELCGMESLVRWNHPEKGLTSPFYFIALAEETGQIIDIDNWVMKTAMRQFSQWEKEGYRVGKLSLNLSLLQLKDSNFINKVTHMISESGINPKQLQFEITETQIMADPEESIRMMKELKTLGITLAIDDFGTGQSSLSYLKRLPVDKIKIDQSFIRGIPHDQNDVQLTKTIISMSQNLNFALIAEGVETPEQASFLLENGCFEAQGYLYHRPINAAELESKLVKKS